MQTSETWLVALHAALPAAWQQPVQELTDIVLEPERPLRVVLAGAFTVGKSSLVNMLTGSVSRYSLQLDDINIKLSINILNDRFFLIFIMKNIKKLCQYQYYSFSSQDIYSHFVLHLHRVVFQDQNMPLLLQRSKDLSHL